LAATLELILLLLRIRFNLNDQQEFDLLRASFCPEAQTIRELDRGENCWEDVTNASLGYLLKNCMAQGGAGAAAKGSAVSAAGTGGGAIKPLQDVEKLK
jgi:hypothetical protein